MRYIRTFFTHIFRWGGSARAADKHNGGPKAAVVDGINLGLIWIRA